MTQAHSLTICLPSVAANSSGITSMPQADRGGIHEDSMGNKVVRCSVRYLRQRLAYTDPHRGRLRCVRKCTEWVQAEAVGTRRGVRLKESTAVDGGCIVKARACVVINNFSELYWREAVEHCWDTTAKLPFISTTWCTPTIRTMNKSIPNIKTSQCLL